MPNYTSVKNTPVPEITNSAAQIPLPHPQVHPAGQWPAGAAHLRAEGRGVGGHGSGG